MTATMNNVFITLTLTLFLLPKVIDASIAVSLLINSPFLMTIQTKRSSYVGFDSFGGNDIIADYAVETLLASETARIIGKAYAYPSPALNGNTSIGFRVNDGPIDILFELYDELGQKIYSLNNIFPVGYNRIPINTNILGYELPVGSYYFLLLQNSEIVTKGKFGVTKGTS